jgi:hypothetical protein
MRLRHANIRLINRRSNLPRLLLALSSINGQCNDNSKNNPTDAQGLTGHSISDLYTIKSFFSLRAYHIPLDFSTRFLLQSVKYIHKERRLYGLTRELFICFGRSKETCC